MPPYNTGVILDRNKENGGAQILYRTNGVTDWVLGTNGNESPMNDLTLLNATTHDNVLRVFSDNNVAILPQGSGHVGIGNASLDYKLEVSNDTTIDPTLVVKNLYPNGDYSDGLYI